MQSFKTEQLSSHNLGLNVNVTDMDSDQLDDYLALGTSDGTVHIKKVSQRPEAGDLLQIASIKCHTNDITCVRWLPIQFSRSLIVGCDNGQLLLVAEQNQSFQIRQQLSLQYPISDISVCGEFAVVSTLNNEVIMYKVGSNLQLSEHRRFTHNIPLAVALTQIKGRYYLAVGTFLGDVFCYLDVDKVGVDPQTQKINNGSSCRSLSFGQDAVTDFVSLSVGYQEEVVLLKCERDLHFTVLKSVNIKSVSRVRASVTGRVLGVVTEDGQTQLLDIAEQR